MNEAKTVKAIATILLIFFRHRKSTTGFRRIAKTIAKTMGMKMSWPTYRMKPSASIPIIIMEKLVYIDHLLVLEFSLSIYFLKIVKPNITDTAIRTINRKNINLAIEAAPAAMSVKPNIAAIIAITKNISVHLNIIVIV